MGYGIRMHCMSFKIKDANKKAALQAIRSLWNKGRHDGRFSWVSEDFNEIGTLEKMLEEWRYEPTTDPETGDITKIDFIGEKYGDCEVMFKAIAPYVEAGSVLEYLGEDGDKWRYKFNGKTMEKVKPKVVWE